MLPDGTTTIVAGFTTLTVRLAANELRDWPERSHTTFLAHVHLTEIVVFGGAPPRRTRVWRVVRSFYDSREGIELVVFSLYPR